MTKRRVLVVADSPQDGVAATSQLAAAGYAVVATTAGEDPLDVLAREPCDLVVLDARMFEQTRRALAEQTEARRRVERDKRRIAGMIVHDLRSPVAAVLANAEVLKQSASPEQIEMLDDIVIAVQQIDRTARDLRDLARAAAGELSVRREPFRFAELAEDVAATMRGVARWTGIDLQFEICADQVIADRELMFRLLENLVHNAIKHAPRHSVVRIEATVDGDGLLVRVLDQGLPVTAADAEHIFDRYAHTESEPPRSGSHTFGLTFCRVAAEAHGGRIWVEHQERGAAFCVQIPQPAERDGVHDPRSK